MLSMKICSRCKESLPLTDFNKAKSRKDGYNTFCRKCNSDYLKEHYNKNKQYYVDKANRQKRKVRKAIYDYLKSQSCDCGEDRVECLQFHHVDSTTKEFTLSSCYHRYGLNRLMLEIQKCKVVCANCHAVITAQQMGWYNNLI